MRVADTPGNPAVCSRVPSSVEETHDGDKEKEFGEEKLREEISCKEIDHEEELCSEEFREEKLCKEVIQFAQI